MVARFFLVQTYQNGKNIPNDYKLYQTALHYAKWPKLFQMIVNIPAFSIARPSKIYPNFFVFFGFEKWN
jgi:hypothetical protein